MFEIDIQAMKRIAFRSYEREVEDRFGPEGIDALREVLEALIQLYQVHDAEGIEQTLIVVKRLPNTLRSEIASRLSGSVSTDDIDLRHIKIGGRAVTVVDLEPGNVTVWDADDFDSTGASHAAIVYRFAKQREWFVVDGVQYELDKPSAATASNFSRPRFSSLRAAILDYGERLVRTSACFIFREVWFDSNRLFLKTKPEKTMRKSLHQHLRSVLPDAVTRPEQVVDESHPVDLRVEWDLSSQEAIIEIKWMGYSRNQSRITLRYAEPRARKGAKQLANYLTSSRQSAPTRQTRAYLVVIDARRRGLDEKTTSLPASNGFYFQKQEISFNPEYHKTMEGFEEPLRLFAEPVG